MKTLKLLAATLITVSATGARFQEDAKTPPAKGRYADMNDLRMYYEVHGEGRPLVLLHGAFGVATVYPELAKGRQVVAIELQGHGHTADIDRPLAYEQMADDTAELLKRLKIEQADFFGYSMGGTVALAVAIRHPGLVRRLAFYDSDAGRTDEVYDPEIFAQFKNLPADFAPPVLKDPYDKIAPDPKKWLVLVAKIKRLGVEFKGFAKDDLRAIKARVLITMGDRDVMRPEHGVEMFRLIPDSQLAVIPGADHFLPWQEPGRLFPSIASFLNAPEAPAK